MDSQKLVGAAIAGIFAAGLSLSNSQSAFANSDNSIGINQAPVLQAENSCSGNGCNNECKGSDSKTSKADFFQAENSCSGNGCNNECKGSDSKTSKADFLQAENSCSGNGCNNECKGSDSKTSKADFFQG